MVHVRFIVTISVTISWFRLLKKSEMEEGETLDQAFKLLSKVPCNVYSKYWLHEHISIFRDLWFTCIYNHYTCIEKKQLPYDIPPLPRLLTKTNCLDRFPFCFSVIVLAVRGDTLRALMIHAYDMGLIKENYMFICVYYYSQKNTFGDISWKQVLINTFTNRPLKVKKTMKYSEFFSFFFNLDTAILKMYIALSYYGIVAIWLLRHV